MSKQINSNDKTTRLVQLLGRVTLFVGLIVAACLLLDAKPTETELRSGDERSAKRLVSLHSDPDSPKPTGIVGVGTRPIEQIKVGDRVMARNPEVSDAERASWTEPDWNQWLHLSLVMPKEDGSELKIELLRPESWLLDQMSYVIDERSEREPRTGATSGKALPTADKDPSSETHLVTNPSSNQTSLAPLSPRAGRGGGGQGLAAQPAVADIPLSPLRPFYREVIITTAALHASEVELVGLTVVLDLPEMGATGTAVVTNVTACPMVRSGAGQPITATFSHPPSTAVLNVVFSGESQPIGVTDNHLFWSVDRQQFLPIGKMEIGEQVQTFHGETKRIEAKLPRPGPQVVYNLEVYGEHVYFVGSTGMLAHNMCTPLKGGGVRGHGALQDLRAPSPGLTPAQRLSQVAARSPEEVASRLARANDLRRVRDGIPSRLYHYTDEAGEAGIRSSQELFPSLKALNPKDARYGDGQYLTDIVPGTRTPAQLSRAFIGQPFQGRRFTNAVEIDVTGLRVIRGRDGVFVVPNQQSLPLSGRLPGGSN